MSTGTCVRGIYALALVLLGSCAVTALNVNNICLLLKDGARLASNDSCSTYYSCSDGVATLQNCSPGTFFDKNVQTCVAQAPSYCTASGTDPCTGHAIGSYTAVPGSCSGFYYCSPTGAQRSSCPNNLVFNPATQACDYKSNYLCEEGSDSGNDATEVINLCSYVQDGIYFGNAFSCAGWQKCKNDNTFITGSCKNGLVFNPANAICDYPANVQCSQVTYDPSLDVTSASNGGGCTENGALKKATPCNEYYQCNGANWQLKTCAASLYYDTRSQKCVDRLNAYNDCDRCVGTTDTFVNAFGTNCTGYLYCSNGVEHSNGTCASGLFFNEILGGCVNDNPNFTFCSSSTTDESTTANPAEDTTTEKPAEDKTTGIPAGDKTTEKPAEDKTTGIPAGDKTTEKPAEDKTTENPAGDKTTEKPAEDKTTGIPAGDKTTEKPAEEGTTEKTGAEETTEKSAAQ